MHKSEFKLYHYQATLRSVMDGDSMKVILDLGDGVLKKRRIRITGYNAPDRGQPGREEARRALTLMLPIGERELFIVTDKDAQSFERLLGDTWIEGDEEELYNVAVLMRDLGHHVERA